MGFFSSLFRGRDAPTDRTSGSAYSFFMGGSTSGKRVNERTAMHHPLYFLLHDEPNPEMTSFVFRETLMTHLLLWGNAYSQIIRNARGEIIALYPLMPDRMTVNRDGDGCVEDSIADHSAYLLGAKNGNKLRYDRLKGCTVYKKAVQIIKDGGYATSLTYVEKLCSIIERWKLTQYDVAGEASDVVKYYRVRKNWEDAASQLGAYTVLSNAKAMGISIRDMRCMTGMESRFILR